VGGIAAWAAAQEIITISCALALVRGWGVVCFSLGSGVEHRRAVRDQRLARPGLMSQHRYLDRRLYWAIILGGLP
jgi:hypothetical protein